MRVTANKILSILLTAVFLVTMMSTAAFAENSIDATVQLENGSVAALPENLIVRDNSGRSVSERGEYFFEVEDMVDGTTYVKNIQIMNLRRNKAYKILFSADPVAQSGDIDLLNECTCNIFLDDEQVYTGKVTGDGSPDIRLSNGRSLDLGVYSPGKSRTLRVEITWNWAGSGTGHVDNGHRIVDSDGIKVLRPKEGKDHAEGEILFKWVFSAKETEDPDHPDTPVDTGDMIGFIGAGVAVVAIIIMFFLVMSKKKKKENGPDGPSGKSDVSSDNKDGEKPKPRERIVIKDDEDTVKKE